MTPESAALGRLLAGDPCWNTGVSASIDRLIDEADEHGISTLVWQSLEGAVGAGTQLRERLTARVRAAATRDLFVQREMQRLLAGLDGAGVPSLVIKGSALAYTVYEQPWLRPRTDSDVLIRHAALEPAFRVLAECGYRRSDALTSGELVSHQVAFERIDEHDVHHVVDLHWKLVNPQMLADALPFDALWSSALPAPALGPSARVPSHAASIAIGNVHRLAHHQGQDRLIWLVDFLKLAGRCDDGEWTRLTTLARAARVAGLCLDGLTQARSLGASVPEWVSNALAEAAPHEPSRVYLERTIRKRDVLVHDLKILSSWRTRLRLLREHVFPPPAFIRHRYVGHGRWPLPALYIHRLVTGAIRWVRP
jgi:hypothetical protein